ncbi:PREDICTED: uncharacterized protein LOC109222403 [Nicotiana attenuata]|uniref:uncharacterized protein LOC109222403 n=1 Tax=Nicotiana attenuata TaxID=49451 RepID=UPI0009046F4F|nr:PREDICTED: uncharacterized protein LOC109222403 [Nicotiana attenuata]
MGLVETRFIHCEAEEPISQKKWLFTVVYAYNELNPRQQLWEKLIGIGSNITSGWLISGDFNNVLQVDDKIGAPVIHAEVQGFKKFLDRLQFTPLKAQDEFLNPGVSDHSPILMNCMFGMIQQHLHPRPFRLYRIVLHHPEFTRIVKEVWAQNDRGKHIEQEKEALLEVEKWSDIDEQVLRQKSRAIWIQHGDANTKYFHAQWKMRTNTNAIISIQNDAGIKLTEPKQVEEQFLDFFKKLMGKLPKAINNIAITIIPKVPNPTQVKDFRPTACCTTIYKIITKIITGRLKAVMNYLVGDSQSTFIEGRNITDSILFTHELFKGYTRKGISSSFEVNQITAGWNLKFLRASGLQANPDKSSVYLAGINERMKELILQELGYNEVIFGMQSYWAQVFLLPKKISKMIEAICRTYRWTCQADISRRALVAWDKICLPQTMGGLNVINLCNWNKAAIVKHLWAITKKKDCLWIRWVHSYYIKNRSIDIMPIPKSAAWVVRKIIEQRNLILNLPSLQGNIHERLESLQNTSGGFSIKKLYNLQTPQGQKVYWKSLILHPHIHPRHKFNLWLAIQRRLPTVDRLQKMGVQVAQLCVLCGQEDELFEHLFFECSYTNTIWKRLLNWLGIQRQIQAWEEELHWVANYARKKKGIGNIIVAVFGMLMYSLWRDKNMIRFQNGSTSAEQICREITTYIHIIYTVIGRITWKP